MFLGLSLLPSLLVVQLIRLFYNIYSQEQKREDPSQNQVLTKDIMIKRNWVGNPECFFCECNETIDHLFFKCSVACVARCIGAADIPGNLNQCWSWLEKWLPLDKKFHVCGTAAICWAIWKARNNACFNNKIIKNPLEIICHVGALMKFWAGLYAEVDKEAMKGPI